MHCSSISDVPWEDDLKTISVFPNQVHSRHRQAEVQPACLFSSQSASKALISTRQRLDAVLPVMHNSWHQSR